MNSSTNDGTEGQVCQTDVIILFESRKCSIIILFFFFINDRRDQLLHTRIGCEIVNYLQGNSYGTPIIFCLLEETLFSPCLTTKSLKFGLVKFTKSLCNMTQLNLRPRESQA